jgi:glyoxylase-like metal-dependent hydrolase (beta-lactamase superfamily II)
MLIDPSLSARNLGLEVDIVALTHAHEDHAAGVSGVSFHRLTVHEADVAALRDHGELMRLYGVPERDWAAMTEFVTTRFHFEGWPEAEAFVADTVFDLGGVTVRAVHAPGHTAGHTVYLVEPDGVLITGDIDLSSFGPYYGDAQSSLDEFEATLAMVKGVEAAHYVTYHHKGVVDGHAAFAEAVTAYAAVIDRRTAALLAMLDAPRRFDELVATGIVYRPGTRPVLFGESVERYTIRRHLDRLVAQGAARGDDQGWERA